MIIALPGETADSWLQSLDHNYRLGIDYIRTYFLNIVPNTPMYSNEYRNTHGIKTKLLRFPYEFSNLSYKALHLDINHTCSNTADQEEVEIAYQCNSYDLDELLRMFDYHWFYHNLINTDGIKPIVQDVVSETNAVFASLDRMPFIRSLVEKNRTIVQQMFAPDPVTDITSLGSYLYFSRCMRTDDVYQLWNNQQAVVDELGLIYGTVAVSNCVAKWKKQFDMQLYGTDANLRSSNA
jgi:hypothetical protein